VRRSRGCEVVDQQPAIREQTTTCSRRVEGGEERLPVTPSDQQRRTKPPDEAKAVQDADTEDEEQRERIDDENNRAETSTDETAATSTASTSATTQTETERWQLHSRKSCGRDGR
jgi:hypothetical protein